MFTFIVRAGGSGSNVTCSFFPLCAVCFFEGSFTWNSSSDDEFSETLRIAALRHPRPVGSSKPKSLVSAVSACFSIFNAASYVSAKKKFK